MPLVMGYLRSACERYIDLKPLLNLLVELEQHVAKRAGQLKLIPDSHFNQNSHTPSCGRGRNRERRI